MKKLLLEYNENKIKTEIVNLKLGKTTSALFESYQNLTQSIKCCLHVQAVLLLRHRFYNSLIFVTLSIFRCSSLIDRQSLSFSTTVIIADVSEYGETYCTTFRNTFSPLYMYNVI